MDRPLNKQRLGALDCWIAEGNPHQPVVWMLHGFGANAFDLQPLMPYLSPENDWTWVFPNAPLDLPPALHAQGKAWWHFDFEAAFEAIQTGRHRDLTQKRPEGMDFASDSLREAMKAHGAAPSQVILGGFSQGGMVATDVALNSKELLAALFILSGTLADAPHWKIAARTKKEMPFLQSHGLYDQLLPFEQAQELAILLQEAGLQGEFIPFPGGHEIPMDVVVAVQQFLAGL